MNRQQRRREARKAARFIDPETGVAATGTGHVFRTPDKLVVELPPKRPGHHRWILSCAYVVTDSQAAEAHEGVSKVLMGPESLFSFGIGCWDCEQAYGEVVARPCPVGAVGPS